MGASPLRGDRAIAAIPQPAYGGLPVFPLYPLRAQTSFTAKKRHPCRFLALGFRSAKTHEFVTAGILPAKR
jgi:hypothetical protein